LVGHRRNRDGEHTLMGNNAQAPGLEIGAPTGPFKFAWGVIATALSVLYTAVLAPFAALFAALDRPIWVCAVGRLWAWLIIRTCGVTVEIEGLENLAGLDSCILVANHQSFFDIFAAIAFIPGQVRFVAKRELLKIPVLGYALNNSEHIVIDRQSGGSAIRKALKVMRAGRSIFVFAEGHRFSDNCVHEFKDGAAWLAIALKATCIPLTFSGTAAFFPRKAKVVVPGGRMRMTLGKPISAAGLRDRAELTRRLEEAVRAGFVTEL
jgi:1-acyl-sn-glycerol-3-phosphate acyltransferase